MDLQNGMTVYQATGSAFFGDGMSYWINEGVLRVGAAVEGESVNLVELKYGGFMRFDEGSRWRLTKAEAIRDARDAILRHAEKMREAAVKAEAEAQIADEVVVA
jgi:hypothetical protein